MLKYRYATAPMRDIWAEDHRVITFRTIWVALAEAQMQCGLKRIHQEQVDQLREKINSFTDSPQERHRLSVLEEECRHDVMAHIRLFGEICPRANDIIHLGATSCDITDNADLILIRDSLNLVRHRLVGAIDALAPSAKVFADMPCLSYTHYQPAQLTTVGKRFCLWIADLVSDLTEIERKIDDLRFRGFRGATGTQDSYLRLFGDPHCAKQMELLVARKMGFGAIYPVTGQTYSRKVDSQILSALSGIGQTAHKIGTDMRLLQHDGELTESFNSSQVGSSAMPHKRNPVKAERLCSLSRYLVNEAHNAEMTAMTQWLERSLDDSAGRRLYLPNAFLAADAVLHLLTNIANGFVVNRAETANRAERELINLLMEPLLMELVKQGHNRQTTHEILRDACRKAAKRTMAGEENALRRELAKNDHVYNVLLKLDLTTKGNTGLAASQVKTFLTDVVAPLQAKYPESRHQKAEIAI